MTHALDLWAHAVDSRVSATLDATALAVHPVGVAADELLSQIRTLSRGGKRLRAMLLLASHAGHGGERDAAAVEIAAALELFQSAALLHDDVLDGSDTRRGQPSAHRALAALHAGSAWVGDSLEFGKAGAILAGDIALMASARALTAALPDAPVEIRRTVTSLFADMSELVTAGQYLDMRIAAQPLSVLEDQEAEIRATMRSKTASYSAEFPLALGAATAGADDEAVAAVRAVGVGLGIAFQLRDDVLGLTGSPGTTGKPAGDDIREGKRTLIMWHAWTHCTEAQRSLLTSTVGNADRKSVV